MIVDGVLYVGFDFILAHDIYLAVPGHICCSILAFRQSDEDGSGHILLLPAEWAVVVQSLVCLFVCAAFSKDVVVIYIAAEFFTAVLILGICVRQGLQLLLCNEDEKRLFPKRLQHP